MGLLGGSLELDSALGRGSNFHFQLSLPVAPALPQDAPTRNPDALGAMPALIVDDNDVTREVLRHMAESLGWQVEGAVPDASLDGLVTLNHRAVIAAGGLGAVGVGLGVVGVIRLSW